MEEGEFVKRTQERIKKSVEPIVLELLADMVNGEVAAHDIFYIDQRAKKIMEEKIKNLEYFSLEIRKLRKDLLDKNVELAIEVKPKAESQKGETGKRNKRCEPICQKLADRMIAISLSDQDYLNDAIEDDERFLLKSRIYSLSDGVLDSAQYSINQGILKANKKFWGKEKEEITMKQIDDYLKEKL
jgi:hypothetical protein